MAASTPPSHDRVALETKVGFLERTVEDLNEVVLAQGRELERLAQRLAALESRLAATQEDGEGATLRDRLGERPPHY